LFFGEKEQKKKKREKIFFFFFFYYFIICDWKKLKFLIFDTNPISGGKVKTGRVGVFIERKRFFVLRVHTWNIIRKK